MKKDRSVLEKTLTDICSHIAIDPVICGKIYDVAKEKHNLPRGLTSDLVCLRISMSETTEFVLYCLLDAIIAVQGDIVHLDDYYTGQEIKKYSKTKYKVNKIKFPLTFPMLQVSDDQWIGKVNVATLMQLRQAQLINYNFNAQRVMKTIIRGDKTVYKISVNKTAVKEIKKCYQDRTFIPNTITLNIPLEDDSSFYYDGDKWELVINQLQHFHILDGYHRYLALCQCADNDINFDYQIELRIVNWDDAKSQTFIWQEDKKTPLKKMDAESMNMNKTSNIIVERLNNNINCNMKGFISRNDGMINFGEMSELVNWFYVKNAKKENMNALQIKVVRELTRNLNILTEYDVKYLEQRWNYKLLLSVMCVFDYCRSHVMADQTMCKLIGKVYDEILTSNDKKFNNKTPRKALINSIMDIIERNMQ